MRRPDRLIPLVAQLRGLPADELRAVLRGDLTAGLTTAVMLIPQAMAYALLAGLDPIVGLYASTVPLVLYALFGSSRQLAVGPVAMVSLLVASGLQPLLENSGEDPGRAALLAALLALLVGLIQLGMGLVRLGFLVRFLSHPVISGFTSAAAIVIGLSQLKHLLGAPIDSSPHTHRVLLSVLEHLADIHPLTLAFSTVSAGLLWVLQKRFPRFPRFLLVVGLGTALSAAFQLEARGLAIVGVVPRGFPAPRLPLLDLAALRALLPAALTIALVGFMESISVAQGFARKRGQEIDPDQELRGLGLANLGAAFFQGLPVTGGFSRTAVNAQAGARSGLASVVTGLAVALTLVFLTPLFQALPKAVLAAIIAVAVAGLVDLKEARHLWKVSRPDFVLMGLSFLSTLFVGIEEGILVGVVASLLWFVWKMSSPHVAVLGRIPGSDVYRNLARFPEAERCPGVLALRIDAPLFFANCLFLKRTVQRLEQDLDAPLRHLVLDAKAISMVDASADATLHELVAEHQARGVEVWFSGVRGPVRDVFAASGLLDRLGEDHVVERVIEAVQATGLLPRKRPDAA